MHDGEQARYVCTKGELLGDHVVYLSPTSN